MSARRRAAGTISSDSIEDLACARHHVAVAISMIRAQTRSGSGLTTALVRASAGLVAISDSLGSEIHRLRDLARLARKAKP